MPPQQASLLVKGVPMKAFHLLPAALVIWAATLQPSPAHGAAFADVLDTPAQVSPLASKSLLQSVVRAGDRLIAVGQRGHIVISTDNGANWKQAAVRSVQTSTRSSSSTISRAGSSATTASSCAPATGATNGSLQLNGITANDLLLAAMERKVAAEPTSEDAKKLLVEAKRYAEQGADKPFLDIWFADDKNGYVVGAYNLIFHTADGGKTWEPWFDRTDNPKFFNLYAIRPAAGGLYIAGEGGLVLKLDPAAQRFKALTLPTTEASSAWSTPRRPCWCTGCAATRTEVTMAARPGSRSTPVCLPPSLAAPRRSGATLLADVGGRVVTSSDGGLRSKR